MRFKENRGYDEFTGERIKRRPGEEGVYRRTKDGSLDMRFKVNRGKDKYKD